MSIGKRRSRRPLSTREPLHVTLRSEHARGPRSLLRHRPLIEKIFKKASISFDVRIYERAICGNHVHLLVRGKRREDLQNFFRVVAGHIAQQILKHHPFENDKQASSTACPRIRSEAQKKGGGALKRVERPQKGHPKNRRKFWALLLYSRVVTWGREYRTVLRYIIQNTLEALNIIAYQPRKARSGENDPRQNRVGTDTS